MSSIIKLLYVEDEQDEIDTFRLTVDFFNEGRDEVVELVVYNNAQEAIDKVDSTFDGAIVDLKLRQSDQTSAESSGEGNRVVEEVVKKLLRLPVVIYTGTPDEVDGAFNYVKVCKKGETSQESILELFDRIHSTGLTKILGGRGLVEEKLAEVFRNNLMPQLETWIRYSEINRERTENALLRFTLNHLIHHIDLNAEEYFYHEVFVAPPPTDNYNTGSILRQKKTGSYAIVLNPACDLVVRDNGKPKAQKLLLVALRDGAELESKETDGVKPAKIAAVIKRFRRTGANPFYHWLPALEVDQLKFQGGYIDFRDVSSVEIDSCREEYEGPILQTAAPFIKDIIARFSAFYARQGQPEIYHDESLEADKPNN